MSRSERHAGCSVGGDDESGYVQMMSSFFLNSDKYFLFSFLGNQSYIYRTLDKNDPTIYAYIIVPTVIAIVCFIVAKAYCKRFKQCKYFSNFLMCIKTENIK